jgi:hypothetical protein
MMREFANIFFRTKRLNHFDSINNINSFSSINLTKKCIDCKHYRINTKYVNNVKIYDYDEALCLKLKYINIDTGTTKYEKAYISRSDRMLCSPHGHFFEKK